MSIKENYIIDTAGKDKEYTSEYYNEFDSNKGRYTTSKPNDAFYNSLEGEKNYSHHRGMSTDHSNTKREKIYDFNTLKAKYETKKKRLKDMKNNFNILYEENESLKAKVFELEKYKKSVLGKLDSFNKDEISREKELIDQIRSLENEVILLTLESLLT
jgi:hypothetical protein